MVTVKLSLLLTVFCLLSEQASAMSNGPPQDACSFLQPLHTGTVPQTGESPSSFVNLPQDSTYTPGDTIDFFLTFTTQIRGFIVQARSSEFSTEALGTFIAVQDGKQRTMMCTSTDDTISHMNPNPVTSVSLRWRADSISPDVQSFNFYYTIVQSFNTYWVRASSVSIQVMHPPNNNNQGGNPTTTEAPPGSINYALIKSHGSIMIVAWGLFAPIGILLALFYKVVWPNGEWFYSHIAVMVATLLLTIVGLILIIIHASGLWLSSTDVNLPHQILGIMVCVTVAVNPFMAICRCNPGNQWRFIFNWIHGTTGLVLGQGLAMATMLLGLHIFKDLPGVHRDLLHYAIYVMSAIVGLVIMIIATYNLYAITFRKHFPTAPDELATTSEPPGVIPDKPLYTQNYDDDDEVEPSRDYPLRAGLGIAVIVIMVLLVIANIVLIALA